MQPQKHMYFFFSFSWGIVEDLLFKKKEAIFNAALSGEITHLTPDMSSLLEFSCHDMNVHTCLNSFGRNYLYFYL